ncbi:DUF433 domain-containing protein [Curvibacter lanceolatus]|uniref:DUF433 domain-containing protein n=1 Tax=Curvibacter lanceolatus TaxID=86182 RepID=UPI000377C18F|nr:DUF433 domain-containing protein [Curvibacter lanceolatus]
MSASLFIPSAEAAFIADLSDRQMHRVVDERLLPDSVFQQRGSTRLFTRLGAGFAKFYFATEDLLMARARRQVLDELSARIDHLPMKDALLTLMQLDAISWKVERSFVEVDVLPFLEQALQRVKQVEQADALVVTDPEILGGTPVFAGTRVPSEVVLGSLAAGIGLDRLQDSYPFLTEAHIESAQVFALVHPRRGRPRRLADLSPALEPRIMRVVRHAAGA